MMTDAEAIAACRARQRVVTETTLSDFKVKDPTMCVHDWRTVACDGDTDVIECRHCGDQRTCKCDFDEDFA